jgi:autotransporter translocation and assembly factor TamB
VGIGYRRAALCIAIVLFATIVSLGAGNFAFAQSTQYDGIYAGTQTLTESSSDHNYSQCLKGPFKRKMAIKNGAVTYTYNPTSDGQVTGTVSATGDVTATASTSTGGVDLSGKIQGADFTGEVWSIYCTYALQLKRAP